jgi:hypothetical protein
MKQIFQLTLSLSSFFLFNIVTLLHWLFYENEKEHQQENGRENEEEEELIFGTKRKLAYTRNRPRGEEEREDGCNFLW